MDVINVDEESREKEKDRYVKECGVRLDNPWKGYFVMPSAKKDATRTIVELATIILGDKEVTTGPLLEKSRQECARRAHDEAEEPQRVCQQRRYECIKRGTVGKSQNDGWLRCVRESGKLLGYLCKQVNRGGSRVALQILQVLRTGQSDQASAEVRMT